MSFLLHLFFVRGGSAIGLSLILALSASISKKKDFTTLQVFKNTGFLYFSTDSDYS